MIRRHLIWLWFAFWLLAAPMLAPYGPASSISSPLSPPQVNLWLGTDILGRDTLSRLLIGGQRTLGLGLLSSFIALSLGIVTGLSTRIHSYLENALGILLDALMAIPSLALALFLLALFSPSDGTLALAVGLAQAPSFARLVQGTLLTLSSAQYLEAARAIGAPPLAVAWRHLLPNVAPTLTAYAVAVFSYCLINNTTLSFLGFASPSQLDWGAMLAEARNGFTLSIWPALWPAICFFITIQLLNQSIRHE
ncbi:MAG: ABC transporter permease [Anaerolineae bacterium]|nr:ABC transporter permease [Anaerolineae bacterium]